MAKADSSIAKRLALVVISTTAALGVSAQSRKEKHEPGYQEALKSYSSVLKTGMTPKNVEDFLKSKGVEFAQLCCMDEKSASTHLVNSWKQKASMVLLRAPWFFSLCNSPQSSCTLRNRRHRFRRRTFALASQG